MHRASHVDLQKFYTCQRMSQLQFGNREGVQRTSTAGDRSLFVMVHNAVTNQLTDIIIISNTRMWKILI